MHEPSPAHLNELLTAGNVGRVAHWLMKSEPDAYSIDDLRRDGRTPWDGVRNFQARNYLRSMRRGDKVLYYHSNTTPPGVVGIAKVVSTAYPDPTQFDPASKYYDATSDPSDPRWSLVDIGFVRAFARVVSLDELRSHADALGDLAVIRKGNRLSVTPVADEQFAYIVALARRRG
jgi:predicted RNA-binding protein with PUA-like domain